MGRYTSMKVNGYPIIASIALPFREGCKPDQYVIVADRGFNPLMPDRYVVSVITLGEEGWSNGSYVKDYETAIERLYTRAAGMLGFP